MSKGLLDPDEEALRGVVRALSSNCILRGTTRRDEIETAVAGYRDKYPGLTADMVQGAILVTGGGAVAPSTPPSGVAGTAPRVRGAGSCTDVTWVSDARQSVYWLGRIVQLPVNWKFERMTSFQLAQHWLIGDEHRNLPPLRCLNSRHFNSFSKTGNKIRNKMRAVMRVVEEEARQKDVWIDDASNWDYGSLTRMWKAIADDFGAKYCRTKRKKKELSWATVYGNMSRMNAFGHPRNKASKLCTVIDDTEE